MKLPRKNSIATSLLALLLSVSLVPTVFAEAAGSVTHLSGPLLARKADGTTRILSQKSAVESGDLLVTEKDTYARVKFTDNSEITLKPNTQIKIDAFLFDQAKPEADSAIFNLIKGGLRALTGLVGKRGNQDSYKLKAPAATIGIRGTDYNASWCQSDCGPLPTGLYVQVSDGQVVVSNSGGSQNFGAGQFGFVPDAVTPPVVLPRDPGIIFTPPPSFDVPPPQPGQPVASSSPDSKRVDCEVR